jgi:hypothetical protein
VGREQQNQEQDGECECECECERECEAAASRPGEGVGPGTAAWLCAVKQLGWAGWRLAADGGRRMMGDGWGLLELEWLRLADLQPATRGRLSSLVCLWAAAYGQALCLGASSRVQSSLWQAGSGVWRWPEAAND